MILPNIILWSTFLLVLTAGLFLSLLASRRPTAQNPDSYWLVSPVVALIIAAIVYCATGSAQTAPAPGFHTAATALLLLIGVIGGSPLVLVVLELAGSGAASLGEHGGILVNESEAKKEDREILRGGMTIGYLERLAIIGAALIGQFAAVAIVVAVKGLGRFSELENSAARERFIIGTLVSILWAAASVTPAIIGW